MIIFMKYTILWSLISILAIKRNPEIIQILDLFEKNLKFKPDWFELNLIQS